MSASDEDPFWDEDPAHGYDDEDWEDGWDEDEFGYHGPPMPDPDDQELGPVVALFCSKCKRHTEHLICETEGNVTTYRCSWCYASQRAETQTVFYDPTVHAEMTGEDDPDAELPF